MLGDLIEGGGLAEAGDRFEGRAVAVIREALDGTLVTRPRSRLFGLCSIMRFAMRPLLSTSLAVLFLTRPALADPVVVAAPALAMNLVGIGFAGYDIYKAFAGERCSYPYSLPRPSCSG